MCLLAVCGVGKSREKLSPPGGSDVAVAAIKSAVNSASQAFAQFNESMNQIKELTENNVTAVGNAAVQAVAASATGPAAKANKGRK